MNGFLRTLELLLHEVHNEYMSSEERRRFCTILKSYLDQTNISPEEIFNNDWLFKDWTELNRERIEKELKESV